ncbi:HK97 family phage prohead protease [Devosia sp. A8/3-2]|nr:HK97 family phage prohead protease [Devosia sp. A8/3-2]
MGPIRINGEGRFSGYASVFNRVDAGGDIVMPGAFAKSLATRRDRVRLLFQHDPKEPVGIWEAMREDGHGLFVSGRLVPGVERADALKRLIENGALDGLSIGFRTVKATREAGKRKLWQIDLFRNFDRDFSHDGGRADCALIHFDRRRNRGGDANHPQPIRTFA